MRATSWAGTESKRRQDATERKPSPYAGDLKAIQSVSESQGTVRKGTDVEVRCGTDEPWKHHKTSRPLDIYAHEIEGDCIIFKAYGWQVRVKRIAVALPREPYRSRYRSK